MRLTSVPALTLNSGVELTALGLGVFQSPPEETTAAVETALRDGYRLIDTAAAYGNEREVGDAVRASGLDRSEVFLETKIWISDYGYDETLHGFEKSAGKLGVEQIDLLLLHQALPSAFDRTLEAYRALEPEVQAFNAQHGILTQAWSLIGGITFYREGEHTSTMEDPVIVEIARAHADEMAAIDGLDTGRRGGPEPDAVTLEAFGRDIPEA